MLNKKLIFVSENNNNKFINITCNQDNTFTAEWGRVGGTPNYTTYPESKFNSYYNSKIKKGYEDITDLVKESDKSSEWDIKDRYVKNLVEDLLKAANQNISDNYTLADNVTQTQIDKVQELLDETNQYINDEPIKVDNVNHSLLEIYKTIPRKMKNTKDFLIYENTTKDTLVNMLQNEQQMLDTLSSQVVLKNNDKECLKLEDFGISIERASDKDLEIITKKTDFRLKHHKVWKVTNFKTEKDFNPNKIKTKLLYHGSITANYWSILTNGLKIRPQGVPTTGSMFGNGIYGANKAAKSIGYTSLSGSRWARGSSKKAYLCIFEFATGKELDVMENKTKYWDSYMSDIDEQYIKDRGYDSVFAQAGTSLRNDEFIIYNSNQCTIRYIIEITE